jgi:prepilin-type N-terminal cleavage/methylation domain-containing protein/prepilin-type processing-associated H-X9-DG protein
MMNRRLFETGSRQRSRGFTLIELLVVVAVIATLIGILLPALAGARRSGRTSQCSSNMRQIAVSLLAYSADFKMKFPPNLDRITDPQTRKIGMFWYDVPRLGAYMTQFDESNITAGNTRNRTIGGGAMICPEHPLPGRSYAMNYWASSATKYDAATGTFGSPGRNPRDPAEAARGRGFDATVVNVSSMILAGEAWGLYFNEGASNANPPTAWFAAADIGDLGKPGERFGGGAGITDPAAFAGQWVSQSIGSLELAGLTRTTVRTYIPFYRHGNRTLPFSPDGRANFAKADGSVGSYSQKELAEPETGKSSLRLWWSNLDEQIVRSSPN